MAICLPDYSQLEVEVRTPLITALTFVVIFEALAWVFGTLPVLKYALAHRELPTVGGIKLLSGPIESLGIEAVIVTGLVFVVVSGLKLLAAYWLWHMRMDGAILEIILLGLSAIFWYAFELPFGPLGGVIVVVLLALTWGRLG
ncbi:MAG: hypothetical protein DCC51_04930 [Anaerolineae bacterium]|nr:MAG: hypothetical protein DCC51_04930 [Anaerolineae bacterium]